jgi:hypothetical protein
MMIIRHLNKSLYLVVRKLLDIFVTDSIFGKNHMGCPSYNNY